MRQRRLILLGLLLIAVPISAPADDDVKIVVCGRLVQDSAAMTLAGGRLVAAIKPSLEAFGATVTLGPYRQQVHIQLADGRAAALQVGSRALTVDGVEHRLKAPVRLVKDRCVGPIADIFAAMGADVRWDNESKTLCANATIKAVEVSGDESGVAVRITTSGPVVFGQPMRLVDPPRLYLDIRGAAASATGDFREVRLAGVQRVRWAGHSADPPTVRVVLDLDYPVEATWEVGRDRMSARLAVGAPTPEAAPIANQMPKVVAVQTFAYEGGAADVVALLSDRVTHTYDVLRHPLRIVLDLPEAVVDTPGFVFPGDGRLIHAVRLVPDQEDGHARLILDMNNLMAFRVQEADDPPRIAVRFQPARLADKLIVLDPGHGGSDPGARGRWLREKDLNLDVATRLCQLLNAEGAYALMTRTKDTYFPLYDRPRLANSVGADLFVSIHHNASPRRNRGHGTETYYWRPRDKCLATMLQEEMTAALGLKDNGVRQARFAVLRESQMPAALCEIGYINNDQDERYLRDVRFRQRAAQAIFNGLRGYVEGPPLWPTPVAPARGG